MIFRVAFASMNIDPAPILYKLGQIEVLQEQCNPQSILDGRGAIRSWIPKEPIREFTLLDFQRGKIRGNHFHPEFVEYFLVIRGLVAIHTFDKVKNVPILKIASDGFCFRTPIGVPHAVEAIDRSTCISLITKPWDECSKPIIYEAIRESGS